jgi:S1-C subfamily serine protease
MKIILTIFCVISFAIQSLCQCLGNEQAYKNYFIENISKIDPIEGTWSSNITINGYVNNRLVFNKNMEQTGTFAIISDADNFKCCNISANEAFGTIYFSRTASKNVYLFKRISPDGSPIVRGNAIISANGILEFSYEKSKEELKSIMKNYSEGMTAVLEIKMIKLFPSINDLPKFVSSSGTGFAISSDGTIVTNHHVVNGANKISVRGVNGDFSKNYNAKVLVDDKNNDLAIIKINDNSFLSFGAIPYLIANKSCDVGSSVFCLGYPLRATMGEDVKLTNGIISSKSGFQGDITAYQISAPIQPGNSGGPLYDDKGTLIGIVNAKHEGAENVSYAIKVSYLLNLIDIMPFAPKLQTVSSLNGKTLSEQVKIIKDFTYIIEVNY